MNESLQGISAEAFLQLYNSGKQSLVIDVRTAGEIDQVSLPGCHCLPLDQLNTDSFHLLLAAKAGSAAEPVYLLCGSGKRASTVAQRLGEESSYPLLVIEGGIQAIERAGGPLRFAANVNAHETANSRFATVATAALLLIACLAIFFSGKLLDVSGTPLLALTPLLIGMVIGLVLGLTGAGGSVFAVPLLILWLDLPVNDAIGIALGAVCISALSGTIRNWRYKSILWIPAIVLGASGAVMAPVGKLLGANIPPAILLAGFNLLAIIIAIHMWRQTVINPERASVVRSGAMNPEHFVAPVCRMSASGQFEWRPRCVGSLAGGGIAAGLLAGLFGVGGGFLIVPLLIFLSQVSMQQAVGTSLLIITVVSASGFAGFAATAVQMDWSLLGNIAIGGVIGMAVGTFIGHRIAGPTLQRVFALCLIAVALLTLFKQI